MINRNLQLANGSRTKVIQNNSSGASNAAAIAQGISEGRAIKDERARIEAAKKEIQGLTSDTLEELPTPEDKERSGLLVEPDEELEELTKVVLRANNGKPTSISYTEEKRKQESMAKLAEGMLLSGLTNGGISNEQKGSSGPQNDAQSTGPDIGAGITAQRLGNDPDGNDLFKLSGLSPEQILGDAKIPGFEMAGQLDVGHFTDPESGQSNNISETVYRQIIEKAKSNKKKKKK
jgi:hypothetical protein